MLIRQCDHCEATIPSGVGFHNVTCDNESGERIVFVDVCNDCAPNLQEAVDLAVSATVQVVTRVDAYRMVAP